MHRPPFLIDFTTVLSTSQCSEAPAFFIYLFCADTSILNGSQDLYHYFPAGPNGPIVAWPCFLLKKKTKKKNKTQRPKYQKRRETRTTMTHDDNSAASGQRRAQKIKINKGDERRHERRLSGCWNARAHDLRGEEDIEHWQKGGKTSFQVVSQIGQTRNSANCLKKWGEGEIEDRGRWLRNVWWSVKGIRRSERRFRRQHGERRRRSLKKLGAKRDGY